MIAVIVPFYQRQPGLLHRALSSIAQQRWTGELQVLVTDDGSPVPAETELDGLPSWLTAQVRILRQSNAGPAAARNLALDALPPRADMVAFLDSDDAWDSTHLANIDAARKAGAAFYFADHWRQEDPLTRFAECGFQPDGRAIATGRPDIAWCNPHSLMHAIVRRSPVGTSTVAICRDQIGLRRLRTDLRTAGEDSLFWLSVLETGPRVACSTHCEAVYGRGISVFNHRSWGDERSLRTALDEMQAQRAFRRMFSSDPVAAALIEDRCRDLDLTFWQALFACVRRLKFGAVWLATTYVGKRPLALLRMPRATIRAVRQQFQRNPA
jgi:succinoglycan biosynthesis protein ExoW